MRPFIVAVDGPAGSGKSSVCAEAARRLGWTHVSTGFLYRAVGLLSLRLGVDCQNEETVIHVVGQITSGLRWESESGRLFYLGEDISDELSSQVASKLASLVAKMPSVRNKLLDMQRALALTCAKGAIIDGRDIGTVIFPDADLKVFMTASLEERARRRLEQLRGVDANTQTIESIKREIAARDEQDSVRGTAPLKQADDAVLLDTTGCSVEMSVEKLIELIRTNGAHHSAGL